MNTAQHRVSLASAAVAASALLARNEGQPSKESQSKEGEVVDPRITHRAVHMPTIKTAHRMAENRHGKHYIARHAEPQGIIKQDRKSGEWSYCEWVKDKTMPNGKRLVPVVNSKGWGSYMDGFRPDYVKPTEEWARRIRLRLSVGGHIKQIGLAA
jgi:hypothetical protein